MKTEDIRTCSICGSEFSGAIEFCPVCMLRQALSGGVESGESSASEDTSKLLPERAAQRFEHYELVTGEDGKPVELGRGAMGVTYKAFDVDLHCPSAQTPTTKPMQSFESAPFVPSTIRQIAWKKRRRIIWKLTHGALSRLKIARHNPHFECQRCGLVGRMYVYKWLGNK
jgi:hypothetical protein